MTRPPKPLGERIAVGILTALCVLMDIVTGGLAASRAHTARASSSALGTNTVLALASFLGLWIPAVGVLALVRRSGVVSALTILAVAVYGCFLFALSVGAHYGGQGAFLAGCGKHRKDCDSLVEIDGIWIVPAALLVLMCNALFAAYLSLTRRTALRLRHKVAHPRRVDPVAASNQLAAARAALGITKTPEQAVLETKDTGYADRKERDAEADAIAAEADTSMSTLPSYGSPSPRGPPAYIRSSQLPSYDTDVEKGLVDFKSKLSTELDVAAKMSLDSVYGGVDIVAHEHENNDDDGEWEGVDEAGGAGSSDESRSLYHDAKSSLAHGSEYHDAQDEPPLPRLSLKRLSNLSKRSAGSRKSAGSKSTKSSKSVRWRPASILPPLPLPSPSKRHTAGSEAYARRSKRKSARPRPRVSGVPF
ncbi:uncharacterized protein LOC62_02G002893 [Vanrija pseudolonga]|uniref:Uncharacterized protein n=1 Tax=Vanrija pseudolonga TaxID=143232 RepID=A0AAF0Y6X9_9TREE|nr:hypothetical protein LOC62_02G002893 [Vanrija pseudolonga]